MVQFSINGTSVELDVPEDTPLLWVIRDELKLYGTKFGCGVSACGACTVHVDGEMTRSCVTPVSMVAGMEVTTIEGLEGKHPLQQAWVEHQVPQCGYCQSGQIMSAAALLAENPKPTRDEIKSHMNGNICRCGTYSRIVKAIEAAANTEASA